MFHQVLLLLLSFALFLIGGECVLNSSVRIGRFFHLPPLAIGLIIIGFGTSLPELFVCQVASFRGHETIALGNILGSNIANIFLIMGLMGILAPLGLDGKIRLQLFWHLAITLLFALALSIGQFNYLTATPLLLAFVLYLMFVLKGKKFPPQAHEGSVRVGPMDFIKLLLGFAFLYGGGELLVFSGSALAAMAGISEYIISVIFIAFGTSFPELAIALLAYFRKKSGDLITGNLIGSNIFNASFIMGSLGGYDISIPPLYSLEQGLLLFAALFLLALTFLKQSFQRPVGPLFLIIYACMVYAWI